jgi:hypothetical protein
MAVVEEEEEERALVAEDDNFVSISGEVDVDQDVLILKLTATDVCISWC